MPDHADIERTVVRYYETAQIKHGDSPAGVNWRNGESQALRFDILSQIGDLTGRKVHDVGCGMAHYYDYLRQKGVDCRYVGSDLSARMIEAARQRLGRDVELHVGSIEEESALEWAKADYLVGCGIFTVRDSIAPEPWWDYVQCMIGRMFEASEIGCAFNVMTSFVDFQDDHLFYVSPQEVMNFCVENLTRKIVIRHDYPLWEYSVFLYR